jgi:hypothetical protein
MPTERKCKVCDTTIPQARLDAIPETEFCVKCSEKHGPKPVIGFMVSNGPKGTASVLITVKPEDEEALRQATRAHNRER